MPSKSSTVVGVRLPLEVLRRIDELRGPVSRSAWLRAVVLLELRSGRESSVFERLAGTHVGPPPWRQDP